MGYRPGRRASWQVEVLESRIVLAAFPAYVDGVFTLGNPAPGVAPYGLENTFLLSSNPTATKTIYLDFDGHHSVNNGWNHNIVFPAFDRNGNPNEFTNTELIEIQQHFQNVAEDFLPFDVNVTTQDPGVEALRRTSSNDQHYGVRVVATQATDGFGNGIGGVAFLNSFPSSQDTPVFTFNKGARNGGMTSSHEVGHALGLSHDGLNSQTYHPGTGNGQTGWGPIMGAPFDKNLTQWSKGEYTGATNTQDDLQIIIKPANGFGYRPDDYGSTIETALVLTDTDGSIFQWGTIERNTDVDFFSFTTGAGNVTITIAPFAQDPNLDILATLYDGEGVEIGSSNPLNLVTASFNQNLDAGTYFVSVEGTGRPDRYTDYGSLGYYSISASIVVPHILSGDFNDDGVWDIVDLDMLVADIVSGGTPSLFDVNADGIVDNLDIDWWLVEAGALNLPNAAAYLRGDADLNGVVDGSDFGIWNTFKFSSGGAWSRADFNADGVVDGSDFGEWNMNKFQQSDAAPHAITTLDWHNIDTYPEYVDPYGKPVFWPLDHSDQHDFDHDHEEVIRTVDITRLGRPDDAPSPCGDDHQDSWGDSWLEIDTAEKYSNIVPTAASSPGLRLNQVTTRLRTIDREIASRESRDELLDNVDFVFADLGQK